MIVDSAFPFSNIGFFIKLRTVRITRTTTENPEKCSMFFFDFKKYRRIELFHSFPLSLSYLSGDRFDLV